MKKIIKPTIVLTLAVSIITCGGYIFFEPELAGAEVATTAISLTVTSELNLNCSSTAALSPSLAGQTGGTATGTFGCVVTTNDTSGYNLTLKKDQKLMITDVANQRFDDYATSSGTGPQDWNWVLVGNGNEKFGFSVVSNASSATDVVQAHRDNGSSACGTSTSLTPWHCFRDIPTTPTTDSIINRSTPTATSGSLTVFGLYAQAGGSNNLTEGVYTCTTTVTAVTN